MAIENVAAASIKNSKSIIKLRDHEPRLHPNHNVAQQENQDIIDLTHCILRLEKRISELESRVNNVEANEKWKGPLG